MLPGSVLMQSDADATQLRVLLWLAADLSLAQKPKQLAKLAECDAKQAVEAIGFWQSRGVLIHETDALAAIPVLAQPTEQPFVSADENKKSEKHKEKHAKKHLQRADELPVYTSSELAALMEERASVRELVNEAQQIVGKMFNPGEINILIGMLDYLGIGEEGILMILSYCKKTSHKKLTMRAIEKFAFSLVDRGISDPAALEEEFRVLEALHSFEGKIRSMFGIKNRELIESEKKAIRKWASYGYTVDIVRRAFELDVKATREPSFPYTGAILERWNAEGLRTLEAIDASIAERQAKKAGANLADTSFDIDDFFEAALERSFQKTAPDDKT